ncbi:hypothetical protein RJT34_17739 [Clitoria ternatea]|uniref:Uncharacterized protein n=1 Tax=Clitoria ternatea TaxID=43366 RepID=A0AAN9PF53_CLITE
MIEDVGFALNPQEIIEAVTKDHFPVVLENHHEKLLGKHLGLGIMALDAEFIKVDVWVRILELPLELYDESILWRVGEQLGTTLEGILLCQFIFGFVLPEFALRDLCRPLVPTFTILDRKFSIKYEGLHLIWIWLLCQNMDDLRSKNKPPDVFHDPCGGDDRPDDETNMVLDSKARGQVVEKLDRLMEFYLQILANGLDLLTWNHISNEDFSIRFVYTLIEVPKEDVHD